MFRTGGYMWLLAPTRERGSQKGLLRQPRERGIGAHAPAWAPEGMPAGTGTGLQALANLRSTTILLRCISSAAVIEPRMVSILWVGWRMMRRVSEEE